jgi:hypothetical protein
VTTNQTMVAVQARVINPAQPTRPIAAALISFRSIFIFRGFTSCTPTRRLAPTRNKLFSFLDRCIHPHEYFGRHVTTDASDSAVSARFQGSPMHDNGSGDSRRLQPQEHKEVGARCSGHEVRRHGYISNALRTQHHCQPYISPLLIIWGIVVTKLGPNWRKARGRGAADRRQRREAAGATWEGRSRIILKAGLL